MSGAWLVVACALLGALGGLAGAFVFTLRERRRLRRLAALLSLAVRMEARAREAVRVARALGRRPRRRYVVFEVVPAHGDEAEVERTVYSVLESVLGLVGFSDAGVKLVEYNAETGRGILRVRHTYKTLALAALGLIREIGGRRVAVVPLAVTGSVKRAKRLLKR